MRALPTKLAEATLATTGLTCVQVVAVPGHQRHHRVSIGEGAQTGHRLWFKNRKQALTILQELTSIPAVRRDTDYIVMQGDLADVDQQIRHFAALNGFSFVSDVKVADAVAIIADRIKIAIDRMSKTGALAAINREYKGNRGVGYSNFLFEKLEPMAAASGPYLLSRLF